MNRRGFIKAVGAASGIGLTSGIAAGREIAPGDRVRAVKKHWRYDDGSVGVAPFDVGDEGVVTHDNPLVNDYLIDFGYHEDLCVGYLVHEDCIEKVIE